MLAGIILIVAGILIAVFPQLLSLVVSAVLILAGILVLAAAYNERKTERRYGNPVIELFLRF
jgi:uncharacterized membrane protein HdeD (DUF308 family)